MAINNNPTIKPQTITGIFTKYIAKTLPLAFDESMSYYECLCALLEYINTKVVPALDNNAEGLGELQEFYLELQNYVNDYFENLDVQEEINNKLDQMVEDGVLDQIIQQYLNSSAIWGFDNIASMKIAPNLIDGSYAQTLGYYSKNDGGNALYKIRTITNEDVIDEASIIAITSSNDLVAELIIDEKTNIKQFGAYGDDSHDDTQAFTKYINYCNSTNTKNLNIPAGKYRIYNDIPALNRSLSLVGEQGNNAVGTGGNYKTLILDYRTSSNYLINYDSSDQGNLGNSITNISFSNKTENELKCINFNHGGYKSIIENVSFAEYVQAIYITSTHATRLDNVNCIYCGSTTDNSNVYAIEITEATDVVMQHCMIEHSRFMVYTHSNANAFLMTDCYFEIVKSIGVKGNSPLYIETGKVINNQFVTRAVQTIADAIDDTIANVYFFVTTKTASFVNNNFTIGGSNDGVADNNKKQCKFLDIEGNSHTSIISNRFTSCAFETPAIKSRNHGVVFSNNLIQITIEEATTSTLASKYIIDERYGRFSGVSNNYQIISTNQSSGQLTYIPKITAAFINNFYTLVSSYKSGTSYDVYKYGYESTSFTTYPTLVIENAGAGLVDFEVLNVAENGLYYSGVISFNVSTGYYALVTDKIKKMGGTTINIIKDTDKLMIQLVGANSKTLLFRVNKATKDSFVYYSTANSEITENIIGTIS